MQSKMCKSISTVWFVAASILGFSLPASSQVPDHCMVPEAQTVTIQQARKKYEDGDTVDAMRLWNTVLAGKFSDSCVRIEAALLIGEYLRDQRNDATRARELLAPVVDQELKSAGSSVFSRGKLYKSQGHNLIRLREREEACKLFKLAKEQFQSKPFKRELDQTRAAITKQC